MKKIIVIVISVLVVLLFAYAAHAQTSGECLMKCIQEGNATQLCQMICK